MYPHTPELGDPDASRRTTANWISLLPASEAGDRGHPESKRVTRCYAKNISREVGFIK